MKRKELKRIYKDLIDTNEDWEIQNEYWQALIYGDFKKIKYFLSMGRTARHSIMNISEYREGLKFGFAEVKFNESGWLDNTKWLNEETIEIDVCRKIDRHYPGNRIDLAMGKNNLWTFSLQYTYGSGCGGGWAPNVYGTPFKSKSEAIENAKHELTGRHLKALENNNDPSSCDHRYISKVLGWLKDNQVVPVAEYQLSIF